jgi:hypothetical protein
MQRLNNFTPKTSREVSEDAVTNRRNAAEFGYFVFRSENLKSIAINFAFGIKGKREQRKIVVLSESARRPSYQSKTATKSSRHYEKKRELRSS